MRWAQNQLWKRFLTIIFNERLVNQHFQSKLMAFWRHTIDNEGSRRHQTLNLKTHFLGFGSRLRDESVLKRNRRNNSFRPATLLKKRLWHRCFLMHFAKYLRTLFLTEHPHWLLVVIKCLIELSFIFQVLTENHVKHL